MKKAITALGLLLALACAVVPAFAGGRDAVVLTIDGRTGAPRHFSIADLEKLGTEEVRTSTPWHDGDAVFEGVPLSRLMEHVGASGDMAAVLALNNYRTEVPLEDFGRYGVILAMKRDGSYMPVSDKGPLFIVYPFDDFDELNSELYYSRAAWQVRTITIK
jgi:hypothetical protein